MIGTCLATLQQKQIHNNTFAIEILQQSQRVSNLDKPENIFFYYLLFFYYDYFLYSMQKQLDSDIHTHICMSYIHDLYIRH